MPAFLSFLYARRERLLTPWFLALVVSLGNSLKPAAIDDTAYLSFARQIAAHPLDPYGFTLFWWTVPDNAFEILAPPVVPYWLALGIRVLGESPPLLKLWMFPFVWLFAWSVRSLLQRFARGGNARFLPAIVLSPAVLPTVNLMLDIPALALGLAAIVLLIRATEERSWSLAIGAGLVAGLAMQTKYTALLIPPAIGWYGLSRGRWRDIALALTGIAAAVLLFATWEAALAAKYGRSHFLFHVAERRPSGRSIVALIDEKMFLVPPLAGYAGCLGIGVGLMAATVLGLPRRAVGVAALLWIAGFAWICLTPAHWNVFATPGGSPANIATTFWIAFGTLILVALAWSALSANVRVRPGLSLRRSSDARFLAGWLVIELAGYFALTPFGAARRIIGLIVVGSVLVAWLTVRVERLRPHRRVSSWPVAIGVAAGLVVAAIDTLDAYPEKVCAERAAELTARHQRTVWFAGHWGFQFYCERAGMRQVVPGQSLLLPGDYLVLPIYPDDVGFYRPHIGSVSIVPPKWVATELVEVIWDDPISAQTIPNFYCGVDPVIGRDAPRLRVVVYRIDAAWTGLTHPSPSV